MVLTILLLLLGINKQLDLQTLLNDVGRRIAKADGWYSMRRFYQVIFIATVTSLGLLSLGVFSWLARQEWKRNFVALLGIVFLYVFVLTRATFIHHVDIWLQWRVLGLKWNWILEVGGIGVTLVGALIALRPRDAWPRGRLGIDGRPRRCHGPPPVQPGTWRPGLATGEPAQARAARGRPVMARARPCATAILNSIRRIGNQGQTMVGHGGIARLKVGGTTTTRRGDDHSPCRSLPGKYTWVSVVSGRLRT